MDKILGFFTPKVGLWLTLVSLAIGAAGIGAKQIQLVEVRGQLKTAQDSLTTCTTNLATSQGNEAVLTATVASQNAEIKAMQAEMRRRATLAAAEAKKALQRGQERKEEASRLGGGPEVMNSWIRELFR